MVGIGWRLDRLGGGCSQKRWKVLWLGRFAVLEVGFVSKRFLLIFSNLALKYPFINTREIFSFLQKYFQNPASV